MLHEASADAHSELSYRFEQVRQMFWDAASYAYCMHMAIVLFPLRLPKSTRENLGYGVSHSRYEIS